MMENSPNEKNAKIKILSAEQIVLHSIILQNSSFTYAYLDFNQWMYQDYISYYGGYSRTI